MAAGFHQIPVHLNSVQKTAFVTNEGQYEYLAMPFGLRNAPSVFQRCITKALSHLKKKPLIYIDDALAYSVDISAGLQRLDEVLAALSEAGFSLNLKKCKFMKKKIDYLGYSVQSGEVRPNSRKIQALMDAPEPKSATNVRQFLGLASYFRKFIPGFTCIVGPLYPLTKLKGRITWTPEHEKIRKRLIDILKSEPVLTIFDPDLPVELHTDASSDGYGAILLQKRNNLPRVVEYFSRRTTDAESRYHSYELETLAVVRAVEHFRHYLYSRNFVLVTDCNSLKASKSKKDLTPRVYRWWAYLQAYDFDIMYREGSRMEHADFLSQTLYQIQILSTPQNTERHKHPKVHLELKPFGFTRFQRFLCLGIHIDFTGKLSGKSDRKEYCSVIIDAFTKYVLLEHTLSLDAKSAINALQKAVYLFGASKRIIADQGRCYISSDFKSFCDQYKIELHFIATGSSRANGQVERVMCTLKSILTIVENDPSKTWRDEPGNIQLALNSTKSTVTKYSPSELMFGIRSDSLGMSKINSTDKNNAVRLDLDSVREDASVKLPNLKLLDLTAVAQKLNHFLKIPRSDTDSADSRTMTASSDTMSAHSDPETWDVIHEVEIHSEEGNSLSQVGTAYLLYLLLDIYYVLCVTYVVNDLNGLKFVAKWLNMGEECRPN
ncbi:unnamed protein product [Euphydryas editha]|uniref:RNA-directed DNA polymerase n=1 Tax=Euphydryas editha TaxID=104508 RepID=A0AAU9VFE0_EUPED|nr:unnamed protein product [Euphydryas editha]